MTRQNLKLRLMNAGLAGSFGFHYHTRCHPKYAQVPISFREIRRWPPRPGQYFTWTNSFPFLAIAFAGLVLFVTLRYRRKDAWLAAFMAGLILVHLILHFVSSG